jgi:hypothetical protein
MGPPPTRYRGPWPITDRGCEPAAANFLAQQAKFDDFIDWLNTERSHQVLCVQLSDQLYRSSTRAYKSLPNLSYLFHDKEVTVTSCGRQLHGL